MLDDILESVRSGLGELRRRRAEFETMAAKRSAARDLATALRAPGLSVIAEIKRRSPSRGSIDPDLDPPTLAAAYEQGGAAAVSVLTEPAFFAGSMADLEEVRQRVVVPVLRKDFVLDEVQVWQARAAGADSVLLIVAALSPDELSHLIMVSRNAGMEPLVEVHDEVEAEVAMAAGAAIIGVNNRDLATFQVDLATAERVRSRLADVVTVAESGVWTLDDATRMRNAGYDAVLVGESLVRSGDPLATVRSWTQVA